MISLWYLCSYSLLIALIFVFITEEVFVGSRISSVATTWSWTSLVPMSVLFSYSIFSLGCSDVCWANGPRLWHFWNILHCEVFHWHATIGKNIYGWNTINCILSIWTYINTTIILLPTILLSIVSSTLFRTFHHICIMVSSCAHLVLTLLAGITFPDLITCSAIFFPWVHFLSTKHFSDCVQVSTWKHLEGNSCTNSGHLSGLQLSAGV